MQLLKARNRPLPALALYLFCLGCFTVYIVAAAVNYTHGNGALETLFVCVWLVFDATCIVRLLSHSCSSVVSRKRRNSQN